MSILFQLIIAIAALYMAIMAAVILWALAQESDETRMRKTSQPWWKNWIEAMLD